MFVAFFGNSLLKSFLWSQFTFLLDAKYTQLVGHIIVSGSKSSISWSVSGPDTDMMQEFLIWIREPRKTSCPVYTQHTVVSLKQVNFNRIYPKGRDVGGTERRLVLGHWGQACGVASFLDPGIRSSGTMALPSGSAFFSIRNSPCLPLSGFLQMLSDHRKLGPRHF